MSVPKPHLNDLLKRIANEQKKRLNPAVVEPQSVTKYELGRQSRVIRGRMPGLEAVYDRFSRVYAQSLSHHVRRPVTVIRRATELVAFRDYMGSVSTPAALTVFGMSPLRGQALLVFEHRLVHVLIDLLFGGTGWLQSPFPTREFTGIETRMLSKTVHSALRDLGGAWRRMTPLQPKFERMETNTKFTAIVPQEEIVVSTTFDVEINRVPYTMSLCLPYPMLDPVRTQLEAGSPNLGAEINPVNVSRLEENLRNSKVEVKVELGEARMSLRKFLTLKAGDKIILDQEQEKPLTVKVQNTLKYKATQGAYKGKYAVQICELIDPPERYSDLLDTPSELTKNQ